MSGIGMMGLLDGDEVALVPKRTGKMSDQERAAVDVLLEDGEIPLPWFAPAEVMTAEMRASRLERVAALLPIYRHCGHRADIAAEVARIRKGAVPS